MAVDREVAGRCTCPICGAPAQDVRVNVNQKLYCYCDNGCSFKFNSTQSKQFLPQLRAGRNVMTSQGTTIFTIKEKEHAENKTNGTAIDGTGTAKRTGPITGSTITASGNGDGRITAQRRESDAAASGRGSGRGFFTAWLIDDDDD